jgi:hypothetical protein
MMKTRDEKEVQTSSLHQDTKGDGEKILRRNEIRQTRRIKTLEHTKEQRRGQPAGLVSNEN